jgi:hypothetical protein
MHTAHCTLHTARTRSLIQCSAPNERLGVLQSGLQLLLQCQDFPATSGSLHTHLFGRQQRNNGAHATVTVKEPVRHCAHACAQARVQEHAYMRRCVWAQEWVDVDVDAPYLRASQLLPAEILLLGDILQGFGRRQPAHCEPTHTNTTTAHPSTHRSSTRTLTAPGRWVRRQAG